MNDRDNIQVLAWWACNLGIFALGFAAGAVVTEPWLGLSVACSGALLIWLGYEAGHAPDDPEDEQ